MGIVCPLSIITPSEQGAHRGLRASLDVTCQPKLLLVDAAVRVERPRVEYDHDQPLLVYCGILTSKWCEQIYLLIIDGFGIQLRPFLIRLQVAHVRHITVVITVAAISFHGSAPPTRVCIATAGGGGRLRHGGGVFAAVGRATSCHTLRRSGPRCVFDNIL